jgi:hypothetical protein
VVSGTATYDLPDDFLRLIYLESFATADGVLISSEGIIPLSTDWSEEHTIANGQITFHPTPDYTMDRDFKYAAGWILSGSTSKVYAEMNAEEAEIVLLLAQSKALTKQANQVSLEGWSYALVDERVDKKGLPGELRSQAAELKKQYLAAVAEYVGNQGVLG